VRTAPAALPAVLRAPLFVVALLAAVVVVVLGILHFGDSGLTGVDAALLPSIDGVQPPWRYVALIFDFCGEPVGSTILIAAITLGCYLAHRVRSALLTLLGVLVTVGVTTVLKPIVGRTIHGEFLSYPSGHTALATALGLILAFALADKLGLGRTASLLLVLGVALVAGIAMGWAEVALGAHYPTDALGGFCTALAVVPAAAWLVDRVGDRL
jgi:membrane-associated phospholipid phosphatase